MFVGHIAAGMVAKRIEPRISLGTAVLGAVLADLLVFIFLIAGIEHFSVLADVKRNQFLGYDIVYSHSLLMDGVWGALFAGVWFVRRRNVRGAVVLFAAVISHWVLDVISHRPDMRLAPGTDWMLGLGLWNSLLATVIVEGGFWLLAVVLYVRLTRVRARAGVYVFWIGVVLWTLAWWGNITQGIEPNPVKAGIGGLILFTLIVAWAYWTNRLRPVR